MIARRWTLALSLLLLFATALPAAAQEDRLQSPEEFLGYDLGEAFTPHHRVVDYVEHVVAASPNVQLERYGETYEGRPLLALFVGTPERLGRLEEVRTDNLRRAGLADGEPSGPPVALVWFSYNVHGNESVSTEAAMATLYDLANPDDVRTQRWLEDAVVVIDPCVNPDGRERYVQWYNQTHGRTPNAAPEAREHDEPWPGGRTNHYYFDLNRDWAWATQLETQQRLPLYNRWLPHVHVDFHEMGVNSPYYFAPAAEPFHEDITDFQRDFQTVIGENNARYFDREGWLYFTRQVFDLFYPGYGDTWPIFNGAIGMTYEQGGSGRAGLAIETADGDTLTLRDRIDHHHTTSLSTIEASAQNAERLVSEFEAYYDAVQNGPAGPYEAFVIKNGDPDKLGALAAHLDHQGIRYAFAAEEAGAEGFGYVGGRSERFQIEPGDLIVNTAQPKGRLAKVLLEPRANLADSLTYDITAWALPYAYGLSAYALSERPGLRTSGSAPSPEASPAGVERPYAYLAEWKSLDDLRLLTALLEEDIKIRFARAPFEIGGRLFERGTLVITRKGNEALGARFDAAVREAADALNQPLWPVESGFVSEGPDFGSSDVAFLEKPRVAVLAGDPLSSYATGEIWHFFDQQIRYPVTLMYPDGFSVSDLEDYDVLVLPGGTYSEIFPEEALDALKEWIRAGGRLVALERAVSFLADKDGFGVEQKETDEDTTATRLRLRTYAERERQGASSNVPGAIFRTRLDNTHPLGYGYPGYYHTLKRGDDAFAFLQEGWNVGALQPEAHVSGFAGSEARKRLENTLVFGVENIGRGAVVYLVDDPLFRGFWQNGKLLFGNAVFLVGQR